MLLRTVLDPVTGDLSDTRTRYLGSRPVKLFRVRMQGQEAVSVMPWSAWGRPQSPPPPGGEEEKTNTRILMGIFKEA